MSTGDFSQRLEEGVRQTPFEPFELELPSGARVTIDNPAAVAFRGETAVFIFADGRCVQFDTGGVRQLVPAATLTWPSQGLRTAAAMLLALLLLGIAGSVVAATMEIETIVGTGPVFSVLGLATAECGRRCQSRGMFWVGSSTLVVSLAIFGLINVAEWGPDRARVPVSVLLLAYEAVVLPIGLIALWRMFVPAQVGTSTVWQFDLQSVLVFMGLLAASLAVGRAFSNRGADVLTVIATSLLAGLLITLAAMAWVLWRRGERLRAFRTVRTGQSESLSPHG